MNDSGGDVVRIRKHADSGQLHPLLGSSPGIQGVRGAIERARGTNAAVLIVGEVGTGKSLVAKMICRAAHDVSCAGLTHFPFEQSDVGTTVVLDDVTVLSAELQVRLARLIDSNPSMRLIACANIDLDLAVAKRGFRLELLHRLNTISIRVPNLLARSRTDFEELLQLFISEQPRKLVFARSAIDWLGRRPWPANVRELRNVVQRLAILSERETIDVAVLEQFAQPGCHDAGSELDELVEATLRAPAPALGRHHAVESALIERAIALTKNDSEAARLLGLPRRAMLRRRARLAKGGDDDET